MVAPPTADISQGEALAQRARADYWFDMIIVYFAWIFCTYMLAIALFGLLDNYLPFKLPLPVLNIALFVCLPIYSIYFLRKRRLQYYQELGIIYSELFDQGLEEDHVLQSVNINTLFIIMPVHPAVREERRALLANFGVKLTIGLTGLCAILSFEAAISEGVVHIALTTFFGALIGFSFSKYILKKLDNMI